MKISIIMPSFNQSKFVEAAIQSVLGQDYDEFELLFVDGGSTDDTMSIVEQYRAKLAYCVSEPDDGQSEALHKGFMNASGDVLTWLNTDDLLLPGTLRNVSAEFQRNSNLYWVLGNTIWIDKDDQILKCWRGEGYTVGWPKLGLLAAGGPSSFFKRSLYEQVGGLNRHLHYQMDTELWWKFAMAGEKFKRLKGYCWALRLHEDAKVSGAMFADNDSIKQKKVKEAKRRERQHIESMTADFAIRIPVFSPALSTVRKIISPNYVKGFFENIAWSGKNLDGFLEHRNDI